MTTSPGRNLPRLVGCVMLTVVVCGVGSPPVASANHPPPQIQVSPEPPSGWVSGGEYTITATVAASDRLLEFGGYVEGVAKGLFERHMCIRADCPTTLTKTFVLRPAELPDGVRDLVIEASDWSDPIENSGTATLRSQRWSTQRFRLRIDHSAPPPPQRLAVVGGGAWRSENRFRVEWVNAPDGGTPVVGAEYRLCPVPADTSPCVTGRRVGADLSSIGEISVPGTGVWRLQIALRDAMGHVDLDAGAITEDLRLDLEPPRLAFLPRGEHDPARVHLHASDSESGVATVTIEARREGETTWRTLLNSADSGRISALLDDEQLPAGTYEIRASATDAVGNESKIVLADEDWIELPVRTASRVIAGKAKNPRRNRRSRLDSRPLVRHGARVRLNGRVTDAYGSGRANVPVEVYERLAMPGVEWRRLTVVRTDQDGAFTYSAPKGSARTIRFQYAGTPTTRSAASDVTLRVRAKSTLRPSRRMLTNGESVVLRGRLLGGRIPPSGKLVTLQAWTRRGWLTFGNARARAGTGTWSYRYRFTGTTVTSRYRFRVLIPREESYPYASGTSSIKAVLVRGSGGA